MFFPYPLCITREVFSSVGIGTYNSCHLLIRIKFVCVFVHKLDYLHNLRDCVSLSLSVNNWYAWIPFIFLYDNLVVSISDSKIKNQCSYQGYDLFKQSMIAGTSINFVENQDFKASFSRFGPWPFGRS